MKLSVIILTNNSEKFLDSVLLSVSFADEIVVVDSGSTDNSVNIANKYKAAIYRRVFDDFSSQRNFAIKKAKGEWVLFIDSDEVVTKELKEKIQHILVHQTAYVAYKIKRINYYFIFCKWPTAEYIERLFKKDTFIKWQGKVHESPQFKGEMGIISEPLYHYTHADLESMVEKTLQYSDYESSLLFSSSHPLMQPWRFVRIMITKFISSYISQRGFRSGTVGLVESLYQSFSYFIVYVKLWEKQIKK